MELDGVVPRATASGPRPVILIHASDLSWKGWGWCSCSPQGPIATGHVSLGGRAWRWPAVLEYLDGPIACAIADLEMMRGPDDPRVRMVIEEPPMLAVGGMQRGRKSNQVSAAYGLGTLSGAVQLWSTWRPSLAYPWLISPMEWRKWAGVKGKGRNERKANAVKLCRLHGWARFVDPFPWDPDPEAAGGAQGDVAEAILMGVGAARNPGGAPKGPAQRKLRDVGPSR